LPSKLKNSIFTLDSLSNVDFLNRRNKHSIAARSLQRPAFLLAFNLTRVSRTAIFGSVSAFTAIGWKRLAGRANPRCGFCDSPAVRFNEWRHSTNKNAYRFIACE
jgi:hypothetical protein